jgi:hypothetical protein
METNVLRKLSDLYILDTIEMIIQMNPLWSIFIVYNEAYVK